MRNEIINRINNLFDENVELKVKVESLELREKQRERSKITSVSKDNAMNPLDEKLLEYGRESLAKNVISSWGNEVSVCRDEESKKIKITPYEKWLDQKLSYDIPANMSKEDVISIVSASDYANKRYSLEKTESIEKFNEREKENECN